MADYELRPFVKFVIGENFYVAEVTTEQFEGPQFDGTLLVCARELAIGADNQNAFGVDRLLLDQVTFVIEISRCVDLALTCQLAFCSKIWEN